MKDKDRELREILVDYYHRVDNDGNKELPTIKAISQIKDLVRESLGEDIEIGISNMLSKLIPDFDYKIVKETTKSIIAEMKEKWK